MTDDIKETSVELALELAEVPLDQLLAEGMLRDIPVLGTAYRLARLALSIRDQIFLAKVARFLIPVKAIPDEEREAFARKLTEDRDTARKVGEAILLIIDKLDDMALLSDLVGTGLASIGPTALSEKGHVVFRTFVTTALGDLFQRLMRDQK